MERAKERRRFEAAKKQYFHEILASFRLFADLNGCSGHDFVVVFEHQSKGDIGGFAHRKPPVGEFLEFLREFVLVSQVSGYNSSQKCCRCLGQLEYANNREIRSKVCRSEVCRGFGGSDFFVDRDTNAAINFARIDVMESEFGVVRPDVLQSEQFKGMRQNIPQV